MRRVISKLMTVALASGTLLLPGAVTPSASAQVYSCPPGYYLGSDYQCWHQGYAVTAPAAPYVYYPPYPYNYAYVYPRPFFYGPGIDFRFAFGGHRDFDHDHDRGHFHHH